MCGLEDQLARLDAATNSLSGALRKLDGLHEHFLETNYPELLLSLNRFLASPSEANKAACLAQIEKLSKEGGNNPQLGNKLIAVGLVLIAMPEPVTTVVGLALVAAGKKMRGGARVQGITFVERARRVASSTLNPSPSMVYLLFILWAMVSALTT